MSRNRLWRPILLISLVLGMLILAPKLGVGEQLKKITAWIESLGPWGPLAFIGVYIVATVAALPGFILTVAAGALFGSVMGVACVSVASVTGAALAFLIARYFARDSVTAWVQKNEKFKRLDASVTKQGDVMVALVRLVPIFPFNLVNYGFGLTQVPFWTFVFWSWLCMLPGTALYVIGTDAVATALREGKIPWALLLMTLLVLAAVVWLVRQAKRRLNRV